MFQQMVVHMSGALHSLPPERSRQARTAAATQPQQTEVPFAIIPIGGKGLGAIATRDILLGDRLLAESALVVHEPSPGTSAEDAMQTLSEAERARFFALAQNTRFGETKTVFGIFGTNAMPCHPFDHGYKAIFPVAARFNHSCDPNAIFKFNSALGAITIHACKHIAAGSEICVCYGFASGYGSGCLTRAQRRPHLKSLFGFDCTCAKCSLVGDALRQSDERMAKIGDGSSLISELARAGSLSLPGILHMDPAPILAKLDERYRLVCKECPDGLFYGVECVAQAFVEYCEAVGRRLTQIVQHSPRGADHLDWSVSCGAHVVPLRELRAKCAVYMDAARRWAELAMECSLHLEGEDSPTYQLWAAAVRDGCWRDGKTDAPTFCQRWITEGLAAPLSPRSANALSLGEDEPGAGRGKAKGSTLQYLVVAPARAR